MADDVATPRLSAAELVDTVRALADVMARGGIIEVDVALGDAAIRLRGDGRPAAIPANDSVLGFAAGNGTASDEPDLVITAPMIGTYYSAPTPNDPPFVAVGDRVDVGQTVGIIEAMKIMNEIAADRAGLVTAVHVANGEAVEYGSPIVSIDPTRAGGVTVVGTGS